MNIIEKLEIRDSMIKMSSLFNCAPEMLDAFVDLVFSDIELQANGSGLTFKECIEKHGVQKNNIYIIEKAAGTSWEEVRRSQNDNNSKN